MIGNDKQNHSEFLIAVDDTGRQERVGGGKSVRRSVLFDEQVDSSIHLWDYPIIHVNQNLSGLLKLTLPVTRS